MQVNDTIELGDHITFPIHIQLGSHTYEVAAHPAEIEDPDAEFGFIELDSGMSARDVMRCLHKSGSQLVFDDDMGNIVKRTTDPTYGKLYGVWQANTSRDFDHIKTAQMACSYYDAWQRNLIYHVTISEDSKQLWQGWRALNAENLAAFNNLINNHIHRAVNQGRVNAGIRRVQLGL